jgi:hypothetical protein
MSLICKAKESSTSVKSLLADILNKLEIENGFIEDYEHYEPESQPPPKFDKRKSSEESIDEAPERKSSFGRSW